MSADTLFRLDVRAVPFGVAVLDLLFGRCDWPYRVAEYMKSLEGDNLCRLAAANPEPLEVQPRTLCIAETEHGVVVLNWFDVEEYQRLYALGYQTPHRHHFDFGARILRGGYVQWLFVNEGDAAKPRLRFGMQMSCGAGDGYFLDHQRFHHVFAPQPETLTLMIRSANRALPERACRPVTRDQLLQERDALQGILSALPLLPAKDPSESRVT